MANSKTSSQTQSNAPRILVVDDETRLLSSLKIILEQHGLSVVTANGGKQACEILGAESFDIVLLDLLMPEVNGQQVMRFMAAQRINSPVIIISVETSVAAVSHALRKGACSYLKKPFAKLELLNSIDKVLDKKRVEQELKSSRKRLHKATQLRQYILNSSPDIVFILDRQGRFTFLNRAVEKALGYKPQELQGRLFTEVLASRELASLKESIADIKRGKNLVNTEVRLRSNNEAKSIRTFEMAIFPIHKDTLARAQNSSDSPLHNRLNRNIISSEKNTKKSEGQNDTKKTQQMPDQFLGIYGSARDITERKAAQEFLNFQAYHDLLTRLPNRRLFNDRLHMAITHGRRHNKKLAVLFLDLDRFKLINDSLGHTRGDQLLQSVAQRLQNCLREGDTLSRFGGDEFVLLLPDLRDQNAAGEVAQKIIHSLQQPFLIREHKVNIGVSIGIAVFPNSGTTMEQLIQSADTAMYQAKENGKPNYQFFDHSMISNQQELASELSNALNNGEFEVYYQPQLNAGDGSITGVEALVRWHHPKRGILHPAMFITKAEETSLLADISEWVLRTACQQGKQWIDAGYKNIRLAVNMSAAQLEHPELVFTVKKALEDYNFPATNLELELTENMIMGGLEPLIGKLENLCESGVTIAIDDFGTGHSSLSWLKRIPINTLKVDKSFVHDISDNNDTCIITGIVAMAHGLKLNIVAEGVETQGQLNYLKKLGCQQFQGFFFAEARPAADISGLLGKNFLSCPSISH